MRCRVLLIAVLVLPVLFVDARAQDPACEKGPARTCSHGGYDLWDVLRMLPVRFTEFDDRTIRWKYQDEYTVKLGEFTLQPNAQYISREKKMVSVSYVKERKDSDWLCYYCSSCHALLRAYELKPGSSNFD